MFSLRFGFTVAQTVDGWVVVRHRGTDLSAFPVQFPAVEMADAAARVLRDWVEEVIGDVMDAYGLDGEVIATRENES